IYNMNESTYRREKFDELIKKLETLPDTKIDRYAYLIWLAYTSIPEYFVEYETINSPFKSSIALNERNSQSFISTNIYNKVVSSNEYLPDVSKINGNIVRMVLEKYHDLFLISGIPIWIKGKVLESHHVVRYNENKKAYERNYVTIEVLDDITGNFPKKHVKIVLYLYGHNRENMILQEGHNYLIPFEYRCQNDNYIDRSKNPNLINDSEIFQYHSSVLRCLKISDENTISRINRAPYYIGSKLFPTDVITYTQAKEILQKSMDLLRSFSKN
ncbi:MAG: hypothetical protein KAT74_00790, partial [Candidatus Cloacimonetes bacterium]|nr:hypothetical protein [Candidatus Cloacimonadota bacterium]